MFNYVSVLTTSIGRMLFNYDNKALAISSLFFLSSSLVVDCGALPDPQFGDVFLSGTFFQSTATYQCFNGYTISGSDTRTCQANGRWSGVEPTCNRKYFFL